MIPQLLFARFIGTSSECCDAAIVMEIDRNSGHVETLCAGCLKSEEMAPRYLIRMALTDSWPWRSLRPQPVRVE